MDLTMRFQHKGLAAERWDTMALVEQMAHVGSEVSRALNWRAKGKADLSKKAFYRALELIDLTAGSMKGYYRLRELLRTREALVDFFYGSNRYASTEALWRKYFDYFNYAARKDY